MESVNALLDYQSRLLYNRQAFLINHPEMMDAFGRIDKNFNRLRLIVGRARDKDDRTHVSLLPLVTIMQRQAFVVFEYVMNHQSFHAWAPLRH